MSTARHADTAFPKGETMSRKPSFVLCGLSTRSTTGGGSMMRAWLVLIASKPDESSATRSSPATLCT